MDFKTIEVGSKLYVGVSWITAYIEIIRILPVVSLLSIINEWDNFQFKHYLLLEQIYHQE